VKGYGAARSGTDKGERGKSLRRRRKVWRFYGAKREIYALVFNREELQQAKCLLNFPLLLSTQKLPKYEPLCIGKSSKFSLSWMARNCV